MSSYDINIADFSINDIFNSGLISEYVRTDQLGNIFGYHVPDNLFTVIPEPTGLNSTADINTAMKSMRYHRSMMNEFLLSTYLSKEIVSFIPNAVNFSEFIEKRTGKAKNISFSVESERDNKNANLLPLNHKLMEDEGSSQYSIWLKRMHTLEDIQKQLLNKRWQKIKPDLSENRRQSINIYSDVNYKDVGVDDELEYIEDGDITGYAFVNSPTEKAAQMNDHKTKANSKMKGKPGSLKEKSISKVGYDNGHDDYNVPHHQTHNYASSPPSKQLNEIGLKDISDIALTTLAFLSFGMFILQVLMCITMSKDDTSSMIMLPLDGTENAQIDGNTEEIRRKRRSILSPPTKDIEMIDHLAKRALVSLNAVFVMSADDGACHLFSLCENNKFSRSLHGSKKLLIPAWSLGISWLTMELNVSHKNKSLRTRPRVIESLKALIIGLSNGNCSRIYNKMCKADSP